MISSIVTYRPPEKGLFWSRQWDKNTEVMYIIKNYFEGDSGDFESHLPCAGAKKRTSVCNGEWDSATPAEHCLLHTHTLSDWACTYQRTRKITRVYLYNSTHCKVTTTAQPVMLSSTYDLILTSSLKSPLPEGKDDKTSFWRLCFISGIWIFLAESYTW